MAKAKPAIDLEEDAAKPPPTNQQLKEISAMVNRMLSMEAELATKAEELKALSTKIERMSSTDIPEAMKLIGLKMYGLDDGRIVEIKENDYGGYTKENEPAVFKFLRANGHGDLIKSTVDIVLGKGKEHLVEKIKKVLSQKAYEGIVIEFKEAVHPSSFKAFVREQLEGGKKLPKQVAIFHKMETIIKEPNHGKRKDSSSKKQTSSKGKQDLF